MLGAAGCGGDDDAGSSPKGAAKPSPTADTGTRTPSAAPQPVRGVPAALRQQARASATDYLDTVSDTLADPRAATASKGIGGGRLTGAALAQLTNQATELAGNDQRVLGRPRVVSAAVTDRSASPPTLTVAVCVDNSRVKVVDRSGKELRSGAAAKKERSLNLLTLVRRSGTWVVTDLTFPDDPSC